MNNIMFKFSAPSQFSIALFTYHILIIIDVLYFLPRPELSRPRPQAQGQGQAQGRTVPRPRPRNLALRPRINIPDILYTIKLKMQKYNDHVINQYIYKHI